MTWLELAEELRQHKTKEISFFGRTWITIKTEDFKRYKKYFNTSFNCLNTKVNYRSIHWFKHIHAIDNGKEIQFHIDNGNLSKNFLFIIPHALFDVFPFFMGCLLHRKKPFNIDI